jgi:sugar lactone lactonase YvrE
MSSSGVTPNAAAAVAAGVGADAAVEWRVAYRAGAPGTPAAVVLGESPVWDAAKQALLFVDIEGRRVHRVAWPASNDLQRQQHTCVSLPWMIGAVGLVAADSGSDSKSASEPSSSSADRDWSWLATSAGVHLFCWSSLRSTLLSGPFSSAIDRPDTRLNDCKVGPDGSLFAGTLVTESNAAKRKGRGHVHLLSARRFDAMGAVNRLAPEPSSAAAPLVAGASLSNGLDFLDDDETGQQQLLWVDTALRRVDSFALHGVGGAAAPVTSTSFGGGVAAASHRRVVLAADQWIDPLAGQPLRGDPDGLALDSEGGVWVALNGGGCVVRLCKRSSNNSSCTGRNGDAASEQQEDGAAAYAVARVIRFPVSKVTSLCFGGAELRSLFVTSASKGVSMDKEPLAGSVFVVHDVGVAGRLSHGLRGRFSFRGAPNEVVQHQRVNEDGATIAQPPRAKL